MSFPKGNSYIYYSWSRKEAPCLSTQYRCYFLSYNREYFMGTPLYPESCPFLYLSSFGYLRNCHYNICFWLINLCRSLALCISRLEWLYWKLVLRCRSHTLNRQNQNNLGKGKRRMRIHWRTVYFNHNFWRDYCK